MSDSESFELIASCADDIIKCRYYETNGKSPCCTQDCEGCIWSETVKYLAKEEDHV